MGRATREEKENAGGGVRGKGGGKKAKQHHHVRAVASRFMGNAAGTLAAREGDPEEAIRGRRTKRGSRITPRRTGWTGWSSAGVPEDASKGVPRESPGEGTASSRRVLRDYSRGARGPRKVAPWAIPNVKRRTKPYPRHLNRH